MGRRCERPCLGIQAVGGVAPGSGWLQAVGGVAPGSGWLQAVGCVSKDRLGPGDTEQDGAGWLHGPEHDTAVAWGSRHWVVRQTIAQGGCGGLDMTTFLGIQAVSAVAPGSGL